MNLRQFDKRFRPRSDDDRITPLRFLGGVAFCGIMVALMYVGKGVGL